ncbi:MAG: N-acetyl-gamma-glutamyl-phosphate reductase [Myxococcales bacterium]|nr:N-acetyl-gamma-glutamyl-phosphate reductase [Myxococcales bacterium]
MSQALSVLCAGAGGYVGGELLRLLYQHPHVGKVTAHSRSQEHRAIGDVHPTLAPLTDAHFVGGELSELVAQHDVVMMALEHGESARLVGPILAQPPRLLIDLAADFRIADPSLYARYYGPHPTPELLSRFRYGLCDVYGQTLRDATTIAAPGCFATAAQLALYPLRKLITDTQPTLFAITGSSGAGAKPKDSTHHPARAHNLFAYSPFSHRHEAEIVQSLRAWTGRSDATARLLTHSGPMVRGIYLTLHAKVDAVLPPGTVEAALHAAYHDRPLVRVLRKPPELTHAIGSSYALLHGCQSPDGKEIQVTVSIDNLLKGASGQAVQAMNLALGLPETSGLHAVGVFPC